MVKPSSSLKPSSPPSMSSTWPPSSSLKPSSSPSISSTLPPFSSLASPPSSLPKPSPHNMCLVLSDAFREKRDAVKTRTALARPSPVKPTSILPLPPPRRCHPHVASSLPRSTPVHITLEHAASLSEFHNHRNEHHNLFQFVAYVDSANGEEPTSTRWKPKSWLMRKRRALERVEETAKFLDLDEGNQCRSHYG
ncbi:hypothetical protein Fmac_014831 [Flemingia macrophylla]|uniref:Uncharacterized protein n=1 Tax=Flemingia macrophylla TaxID=520843 RepID=A0ABD1MDM7_9FABA